MDRARLFRGGPPNAAALALVIGLAAAGCDLFDSDPTSPKPPDRPPGPCAGTDYPDWQTSRYVLPYPVGQVHVVSQACGHALRGQFGDDIRFAYDFAMPIGSTVTAARSGRVAEAIDEYENFNGLGRGANIVVILHPDGTLGRYGHLDQGGALVEVGDIVHQGDVIGRSGASNLDPGAVEHLHFHAQIRGGTETLPTTFRNTTPNPNGLRAQTAYEALPYTPDDR